MNKRTRRLLAPLAAAALLLSACGTPDAAPAPQVTVTVAPPADESNTGDATAPAADSGPQKPVCSDLTGRQAANKWADRIPSGDYPWSIEDAEVGTYDRCATLSWIVVPIEGPTGSSPYQIMLFNHGEFVQTATKAAIGFHPTAKRLSDDRISVTYLWSKPGQGTADASGQSVSIFTWDEATQAVKRKGGLPPGFAERESGSMPTTPPAAGAGIPGAYPGAGGPLPAHAQRISTEDHSSYGSTAYFKTPSGNIGCDFNDESGGCGVTSYLTSAKYGNGDGGFGPPWWIDFSGSSLPQVMAVGDMPTYESAPMPAQTIEYGQVLYRGKFVCASAQEGLTCWNTETGRGAFMNKAGYRPF